MTAKAEAWDLLNTGLTYVDSGVPTVLTGGSFYAFEVDGTTPKTIYSDRDKGGTLSQPITLDSNGAATAFFDGSYRFKVYNSSAVLKIDIYKDFRVNSSANTEFSGQTLVADGKVSAPAVAFSNETASGLYRESSQAVSMAINGTKVWRTNASGLTLTGAFSATGAVTGSNLRYAGVTLSKSGDYTVLTGDQDKIIAATPGSVSDMTLTLPSAVTAGDGWRIRVYKTDTTVKLCTIATVSAQTIDNYSTLVLRGQYGYAEIRSDGTNWIIVDYDSGWATWTPSYSGSGSMTYTSVSTGYARWKQRNKTVFIAIKALGTAGGTQDTALQFSAPATPANSPAPISGLYQNNSANIQGTCHATYTTGTTLFNVFLSTGGNWTLAANTGFAVSGCYEVA